MRYLLCSLLLWALAACHSGDTHAPASTDSSAQASSDSDGRYIHHFGDSLLEASITDTLLKLPFVKQSNRYIDSISHHQHGMAFLLDSATNDANGITVQAGYNRDDRFETYYRFRVNPRSLEIKVYDVAEDSLLSVKDFIKLQKGL